MFRLTSTGGHVLESAGPSWRLFGDVKRDKTRRNRLTLQRFADELSADIRASIGSQIPILKLTDYAGRTAQLCGATILSVIAADISAEHQTHSFTQREIVAFSFNYIALEDSSGGASASDDWS